MSVLNARVEARCVLVMVKVVSWLFDSDSGELDKRDQTSVVFRPVEGVSD